MPVGFTVLLAKGHRAQTDNMNHISYEALYRAALVPFTILILIGSQLGVAKAALDFVFANSSKRGVTHTTFGKQTELTGSHIQVAEAAMKAHTFTLSAPPTILIAMHVQAGIRMRPPGHECVPTPLSLRRTVAKLSIYSFQLTAHQALRTRTACRDSGAISMSPVITPSPNGKSTLRFTGKRYSESNRISLL